MLDLLFFMILGHYVGDFALQTDRMAVNKRESLATLSVHVLIYTVTLGTFIVIGMAYNGQCNLASPTFWLFLGGVYIVHWGQDHIKAKFFNGSKQAFYFDQAVHIMVIFAARLFIFNA